MGRAPRLLIVFYAHAYASTHVSTLVLSEIYRCTPWLLIVQYAYTHTSSHLSNLVLGEIYRCTP